jgi:prepilin-type N-terminal cleavage/methylation domain-containing protein
MVVSKFRAFTLVELLVVIAVVGLLSTIVLAVTSGLGSQASLIKTLAWARSINSLLGVSAAGLWNMDEGIMGTCSGGQDICDISGWNNHGVISGATYLDGTPSGQGYALNFDGVDDYVGFNNSTSLAQMSDLTLEAWVNFASVSGKDEGRSIYSKGSNTVDGTFWVYYNQGSNLFYFELDQTAPSYSWIPIIGQWYHLVFSYDGAYMRMYKDGTRVMNYNITNRAVSNVAAAYIGGYQGSGHSFHGQIDDVRIYGQALTALQVKSQYYIGLNELLIKGLITEQEHLKRLAL